MKLQVKKTLSTAALIAALTLVLAACGDSKSSESDRTNFIAEANAICSTATSQIADVEKNAGTERTAKAEVLGAEESALTEMISQLEALKKPNDSSQTFDEYLTAVKNLVPILGPQKKAIEQREEVVGKGDLDAVKKLSDQIIDGTRQIGDAKIEINRLARSYGINECSIQI